VTVNLVELPCAKHLLVSARRNGRQQFTLKESICL